MKCNKVSAVSRVHGFSLIEVMIAAVVLATGLIALAALQSSLVRNAADARARSQVAAFVDLAVERVRTNAAGANFADVPPATTWTRPWTNAEEDAVEARAGVGGLNVAVTGTHYDGRSGTFVVHNATVAPPIKLSDPQYKELRIVATWSDAAGATRRYDLTSIISPRTTVDSAVPFDAPTGVSNDSKVPIVRTDTPVEAGVIPIAIGDNTDTAATNPKPTISSGNVIRTSYEVLTYTNVDSTTVQQKRRVETAVVGCTCSQGTAPTGVFAGTAQWPAYWNGERYTLYTPTPARNAPGQAARTGPTTGVTQDELCTQCCRDHHDNTTSGDVEFDPFRAGVHQHYRLNGGTLELASTDYLESCRMIRTDGFWRTAQDLDSKHFGLLKTTNTATSPVPENNPDTAVNSAVEFYEKFVIEFLRSAYEPGQTPQPAEGVFQANGLNAPAQIPIRRPQPTDERYLHTRGLYVDNIEAETQGKIAAAAARCAASSSNDCILPLLPFTSINLTEAAFWSPEDAAALTVDSDGFVVFRPTAPNRGRVNAIATAPDTDADVIARIQKSNSGVAVRDRGIDPDDDVDQTDQQEFRIRAGTGSGTAGMFKVALTGLPAVQRSPGVSWTINTDSGNCQGPSPYACVTTAAPGVTAATITVAAYNQQVDGSFSVQITCPNSASSPTTPSNHTYNPTGQNTSRVCRNFALSSATTPVESGTIQSSVNEARIGDVQSGVGSEQTRVTFAALPLVESPTSPTTITLGFTFQDQRAAPVASCTFKQNGTLNTVLFANCP